MKLSIRTLRNAGVAVAALFQSNRACGTRDGIPSSPSAAGANHDPHVEPENRAGLIFLTPTEAADARPGRANRRRQGSPRMVQPAAQGETAYDFRVQEYHGEPVLTWIQSQGAFSTGPTTDYIADRHYHVIATVNAATG